MNICWILFVLGLYLRIRLSLSRHQLWKVMRCGLNFQYNFMQLWYCCKNLVCSWYLLLFMVVCWWTSDWITWEVQGQVSSGEAAGLILITLYLIKFIFMWTWNLIFIVGLCINGLDKVCSRWVGRQLLSLEMMVDICLLH